MSNIKLEGSISCPEVELEEFKAALAQHISLTQAEPGCIHFSIAASGDDPCVFTVDELFVDQAAFDSHTARTRASAWWEKTKHIAREIQVVSA